MGKAKIHFITGGQRSGKSEYAEQVTLSLSNRPIYLATSRIWDADHGKRIDLHKERRSQNWRTIEEEIQLGSHDLKGEVVLLDCVTLWLTNIFTENQFDPIKTWETLGQEWNKLQEQEINLIIVSNEIGLGVVPIEKGTRNFVDLQGKINQLIASQAEKVTVVISGIPWQIK